MTWFRWRVDPVLVAIVFVALGLRLQLAATQAYIHDEDRTAIPLSTAPGSLVFLGVDGVLLDQDHHVYDAGAYLGWRRRCNGMR